MGENAVNSGRTGLSMPVDAADIEAMLVECWRLWRRSPGGGRWPFAGDGPWHLVRRELGAGDYDARGGDGDAPAPREAGLSIAEVAMRDRVSAWLALVPEGDRRLVTAVVGQLARGAARPDWMALRGRFVNRNGAALGADGLRKRYGRALVALLGAVRRGGAAVALPAERGGNA